MSKCPYCKKPVILKKTRRDARDYPPEVLKEAAGKVNGKQIMYSCPHCECVLGFGFFVGGIGESKP
jgi:pyruvate-formate lyase-activating enzyme